MNGDKTTMQHEHAKDNSNSASNHAKRNGKCVPGKPAILIGGGELAKHAFVAEATQNNTRHESLKTALRHEIHQYEPISGFDHGKLNPNSAPVTPNIFRNTQGASKPHVRLARDHTTQNLPPTPTLSYPLSSLNKFSWAQCLNQTILQCINSK